VRRRTQICLLGVLSLLAGIRALPGMQVLSQAPPGGAEFDHLIPHIAAACAIVREKPDIWPFRAFPYGPLGLDIRKAKTPAEVTVSRIADRWGFPHHGNFSALYLRTYGCSPSITLRS